MSRAKDARCLPSGLYTVRAVEVFLNHLVHGCLDTLQHSMMIAHMLRFHPSFKQQCFTHSMVQLNDSHSSAAAMLASVRVLNTGLQGRLL